MEEEEYFNVDFIRGLCNNLIINQLIVRKEVYRKAFNDNEDLIKNDNTIIHCNNETLVTLLSIFKISKCDDDYDSFINRYWWILSLIGGIILLVVLIWRIWYCCDPKFERTKEYFNKKKKKVKSLFRKVCYCCLYCNDIEFTYSISNDNNFNQKVKWSNKYMQ
jgi:hypothetical protein